MKKLTLLTALFFAIATLASAQMNMSKDKSQRPSPPANAECKFSDGKTIKVDYSSPRAKGRKIFGADADKPVVPYGQIWRTGGQGPRFGDDGSAFDIGSRAVARAMKERDQHGKDSILGMKILEQLDYASWPELQERATVQPDNVFPSVFPIVAAAADAGDPAAREILVQAAGELSSLVNAVAEHSGHSRENIMIVKTGGTVGRCAFFDVQLDAALKRVLPQAQIGGLRMSPAEAAARAARY